MLHSLEELSHFCFLSEWLILFFINIKHMLHPVEEHAKRQGTLTPIMEIVMHPFCYCDSAARISLTTIMVAQGNHISPSISEVLQLLIHCSAVSDTRKFFKTWWTRRASALKWAPCNSAWVVISAWKSSLKSLS